LQARGFVLMEGAAEPVLLVGLQPVVSHHIRQA